MSTDPLARRPGDTSKSWQALQDYAAMGPARSLEKLVQIWSGSGPTKFLSTLKLWSSEGDWQARVIAYDEALAAAERAAREAELTARRQAWIDRQMEADEVLARLSDFGRGSPAAFLKRNDAGEFVGFDLGDDTPLELLKEVTVTKRQIGDITTETTTKIKLYDAHAALVKLGEHHKLWGKSDDILKYIDLSKLDADQLERIANGDNPLDVLINKPDATPSAG